MSYKLGSLFDGSGGFPLSGTLCDIEPMWAAEIEPYPIAVTTSRFPNMKHLGDISKVNGAEIEPGDIITFGSPCQDLSVAGKRAGLKHEDNGDDETTRSGLFMEAVRIIKEMRKATDGEYPKFAVWENVPGAFSSNNGQDFRIVLEELIKIAEPYAVMPEVPPKGWAYADSFSGDGWSLAYRVFDAQYWGVPQRRRRIYLVTDFRGQCATEILFKREGLRGYFTESGTQGQTVTADAERSIGTDDRKGEVPYTLKIRSGVSVDGYGKAAGKGALVQENLSATLGTSQDQYLFQPVGIDGYNADITGDKAATLGVNCGMSSGRNGVITDTHILDDQGGSVMNIRTDGKAPTIRAQMGGHPPVVMLPESAEGLDAYNQTLTGDKAKTLNSAASDADHVPCAVYSVENHPADSRVNLDESGKVQTLTSRMGTGGGNVPMVMEEVPNFIDVEMEVAVRKYEVNCSRLCECLRNHKGNFTNKEIAGALDKPLTLVEHWFRKDDSFAVPDADIWFKLKDLLGIETTEFDQAVTEFEYKGGNYDMRNRIHIGNTAPTLTCASGNTIHLLPSVMEPFCKSSRAKTADDATTWKHAEVANTLNTFDQGEARANEIIVMATQQGGAEICENLCPTITAAAGMSGNNQPVIARPIHSMTTGDYMQVNEEKTATLLARDYKDPTCVEVFDEKERRYIVRRLTPTECARLQGFPDKWGHLEPKTKLTDEEYQFWLNVRKTHDAINDRAVKDYNEKQMLTYYNKLWTDSAEYKMWGNGIALPCALYVMQGIKDALDAEKIARSKWLDELLGGL